MTEYNWGLINSGATFERMMHVLLHNVEGDIVAFGRPGKDAGQDARSKDGSTIYQAKFHTSSSKQPTTDALAELKKIQEYQDETHPNNKHWNNARRWILFTNTQKNPNTFAEWKAVVVPKFAQIGLTAELWAREEVESLLVENPHVADVFFGSHSQVLFTAFEHQEFLNRYEIHKIGAQVELVGRETELAAGVDFLKGTHQIVPVMGPHGVGRTRFLQELALSGVEMGWQVLWLNEEEYEVNGKIYAGIVPERETLLLVDEPGPSTIQRLLRQLTSQRTRNWKIAFSGTGRSEPALAGLAETIVRKPLELKPLTKDATVELAVGLCAIHRLIVTDEELFEGQVWHASQGFPVWINLAVKMIAKGMSPAELPADKDGFAKKYVESTLNENERELVRWVALLQPLDANNDFYQLVADKTNGEPDDIRRQIATLVHRGAISLKRKSGKDLLEIRPESLRYYLLLNWFSFVSISGNREATEFSRSLFPSAFEWSEGEWVERLVRALSRLEYIASHDSPLPLLDTFIQQYELMAQTAHAGYQLVVLRALEWFDYARPKAAFSLVQMIFKKPGESVEITVPGWPARTCSFDEHVVGKLASSLKRLARYVPEEIQPQLVMLLAKVVKASSIQKGYGERPLDILCNLISNQDAWGPDYSQAARPLLECCFSSLRTEHPGQDREMLTKVLESQLPVRRMRVRMYESKFVMEQWTLQRDSEDPQYLNFRYVVDESKKLLINGPVENKAIFWRLLAHVRVNIAQAIHHQADEDWAAEMCEILDFTREYLKTNATKLPLAELSAARKVWDWYLRYGNDETLKQIARDCEDLLPPFAKQLESLLIFEPDWRVQEGKEIEVALELMQVDGELLESFVQSCIDYLGPDKVLRIGTIANQLGLHNDPYSATWSSYVVRVVENPTPGHAEFVRMLHRGRLWHICEVEPVSVDERVTIMRSWFERQQDVAQLRALARELFCQPRTLDKEEADLLELLWSRGIHEGEDLPTAFEIVSRFLPQGKDFVEPLILPHFARSTVGNRAPCFGKLLEGMNLQRDPVDEQTRIWIFSLALEFLPDLGNLDSMTQFYLEKIATDVGKFDSSLFPIFVQKRAQMVKSVDVNEREKVRFLPLAGGLPIAGCFKPLASAVPPIERDVDGLLNLVGDPDIFFYPLRGELAAFDPEGLIVPKLVAKRILVSIDGTELSRWAGFAPYYAIGSESWSEIAEAILSQLEGVPLTAEAEGSIHWSLLNRSFHITTSWVEEGLDPEYQEAIDLAQSQFDQTTNEPLKSFWQRQTEQAKLNYQAAFRRWEEEQDDD